jgi:hypothetical protein
VSNIHRERQTESASEREREKERNARAEREGRQGGDARNVIERATIPATSEGEKHRRSISAQEKKLADECREEKHQTHREKDKMLHGERKRNGCRLHIDRKIER